MRGICIPIVKKLPLIHKNNFNHTKLHKGGMKLSDELVILLKLG